MVAAAKIRARPGPEWPLLAKSKPIAVAVIILVGREECVLVRLPLRLNIVGAVRILFSSHFNGGERVRQFLALIC